MLAVGRFGEIDVFTQFISPSLTKDEHKSIWLSRQKTKGTSDLYVQSNILAPGGSTGWHSHPGHSLIIVTEGKVTNYEGHDPDCKPHIYTQGMGFVDLGGDHVHILRNEGDVEVSGQLLCSSFHQIQRAGLTLQNRGTATSEQDRLVRCRWVGFRSNITCTSRELYG